GELVILPVNHVVDGPNVAFRTAHGSKLAAADGQNLATFEADHYNEQTQSGWSVVVTGRAEVVEAEADVQRLTRRGLHPLATAVACTHGPRPCSARTGSGPGPPRSADGKRRDPCSHARARSSPSALVASRWQAGLRYERAEV